MKYLILLMLLTIVSPGYTEADPEFQHIVVYQEDGKFAGWPANNGAWIFEGDEMLVGFTRGDYELNEKTHNIGGNQKSWLARSTDGGQSWEAFDPENYVGDLGPKPKCLPLAEPINFTHLKFALRMVGTAYHGAKDPNGHFFYTYDGGVTWNGPHRFGELHKSPDLDTAKLRELTPRTDYVVTGQHEALLMLSSRKTGKFASDRIFCARTSDGGQSFDFLSWIVPIDDPARAVMPETFQLDDGTLVTAMRRREKIKGGEKNWVDAYVSKDSGASWQFMAKVGDAGTSNGNPPAIAATADGRLCAVFGERDEGKMLAAYSSDGGKTWGKPIVLRDDFGSEDNQTNDLGYPRLLRRSDGKMVALYYYSTPDCLHHIAATIWSPEPATLD
ncbi:MAG: sialidase family protein [Verrucomicrobiota bacterium]